MPCAQGWAGCLVTGGWLKLIRSGVLFHGQAFALWCQICVSWNPRPVILAKLHNLSFCHIGRKIQIMPTFIHL